MHVRARYSGDNPGPWSDTVRLVVASEETTEGTTEETIPEKTITGLTLSSDSPGTLVITWVAASPTPTDYRVNWAKSSESFPAYTEKRRQRLSHHQLSHPDGSGGGNRVQGARQSAV